MWDLTTALLATAGGASALPPLARGVGGFCAVIGMLGALQGRTWAPTVAALGLLAWFVGQWSFAVRHGRALLIDDGAAAVDDLAVLQLRRQRPADTS